MKNILRSTVLVAALATATLMGNAPANAAGAGAFTADVSLKGFGIGSSTGHADLCVNGATTAPSTIVTAAVCTSVTGHGGANVTADFTLVEDPDTCPATGTASGTFGGSITGTFTWTRVGVVAVIGGTASAPVAGTLAGAAVFAVTSPVGDPCGTPAGPPTPDVKATAAGAVVIV